MSSELLFNDAELNYDPLRNKLGAEKAAIILLSNKILHFLTLITKTISSFSFVKRLWIISILFNLRNHLYCLIKMYKSNLFIHTVKNCIFPIKIKKFTSAQADVIL